MAPLTNNADTDLLFGQYIDVINEAISENRDGFYGKVIKLWETAFGNELMALGVYKRDPDKVHSWYTFRFENGRLVILSNNLDPAAKWTAKVKESYLENVVENADVYIEHPLKIDFDWLKSRIGIC